jgi:SPP1 gp7 family putative phage head morphogenesis protein
VNVRANGVKKKDPLTGLDDGSALAALLRPFYEALIAQAFEDAADVVDVTFSLDNPFVQDVLESLAQQVRAVAETTRSDIQMLIGQQAGNGWSIEELAQAIRDQGVTSSETRALLISRTESAHAYSLGSQAAWKASGVVDRKQWLASDPCDICAPLDGMVVGIDEEFADGISEPPAHPNCRCTLQPVLAD